MPVQINEVVIRTVVDSTPAPAAPAAGSSTGSNISSEELAAAVLEIIKEKKER